MLALLHWLTDPYRSAFMKRALMAVVLVGTFVPTVGVWIVLRRLSYLGDAMSHALLAGVAAAYLLGVSITLGALAGGLAMAGLIAGMSRFPRIPQDAAIGVAETVLFALGLLLISRRSGNIAVDLTHFLFGQITTTSAGDLRINTLLALGGAVFIGLRFHDLRAATFDPVHARIAGVNVATLTNSLLLLLALAVVISLQTVGLLMSVSMLVTPATAARLLTDRLETTMAVAAAFGVVSGILGLTASYHLNTPPGATIALVAALCLGLVLVWHTTRQLRTNADR